MNKGVWRAVGAYTIWGLLPLYWKALKHIPALQLASHRVVWSSVLLLALVAVFKQFPKFAEHALRRRQVVMHGLAAVLLAVNWLTYVWAVNAGFVVETSLGYFINPLLSVVLGVAVLGERLRRLQWVSVAIAGAGVAYLTFDYGRLPWIALILAFSFAAYGLVKNQASLGSMHGLTLETTLLFLPAAGVLALAELDGGGPMLTSSPLVLLGLVGTGVVTTVPLLLFASAARRIPLTWIGVLQYVAPSLQFLLGVFVFRETVSVHTLVGFVAVWTALALFAGDAWSRRAAPPVTAE